MYTKFENNPSRGFWVIALTPLRAAGGFDVNHNIPRSFGYGGYNNEVAITISVSYWRCWRLLVWRTQVLKVVTLTALNGPEVTGCHWDSFWNTLLNKVHLKKSSAQIVFSTLPIYIMALFWHKLILPVLFRVTSLPLGQSYDCPSASEVTRKDMDQWITCILQQPDNITKTKQRHTKWRHILWDVLCTDN